MSRIVTALFASRDEAETARMSLASVVKVESARVIGRDTAGALVGLPIEAKQLDYLQEGLKRGDHVVLATVARGADPKRIVEALSITTSDAPPMEEPQLSYTIGSAGDEKPVSTPTPDAVAERTTAEPMGQAREERTPPESTQETAVQAPHTQPGQSPSAKHERAAAATSSAEKGGEELRIGNPQLVRRAGAAAPEGVERPAFESRTPARRLSDEEVQAGGLLKDRVIEVVEMREEPVISREVVVREEVLIRKSVNHRSETISDTVRRTEVETEEQPSRR